MDWIEDLVFQTSESKSAKTGLESGLEYYKSGYNCLLKRADAREGADIIYFICDAHC